MTDTSLLPPNVTPQERSVASLTDRVPAIPAPIDTVKRPEVTPESFLPFLAWEDSVDVWDRAWPADKRRYVTARSLPLHRIKGTDACLCEYLALAGHPVTDLVTPPQAFFLSDDLTPEEFAAWLASLPEIRLFKIRGVGGPENFLAVDGDDGAAAGMFIAESADDDAMGVTIPDPITLAATTRREAVLIEDGAETKLGVEGADEFAELEVERFYIPRANSGALFVAEDDNDPVGFMAETIDDRQGIFVDDDRRRDDLVAVRRGGSTSWWNVAHLGARQPVSALPINVAERTPDAGAALLDFGFLDFSCLTPDDNDRRMYESWRLAARGRLPQMPAAASFVDYSRLGWPPKTAEVTVDMARRGYGWFVGESYVSADGDDLVGLFFGDDDPQVLAPVLRTINAARAADDRVLVDSNAYRTPTIATAPTINDLTL